MIVTFAASDAADAIRLRAVVTSALRELPGDVLRKLATSWPAEGDLADRIVDEAITEALEEFGAAKCPARQDQPLWLRRRHEHPQAGVTA